MINITEDTFESEVLLSEIPVVVDIWTDWCGPCKQIIPILQEIEEIYNSQVKFGKIDADQNRNLINAMHIMNIPAIRFFKNGVMLDLHNGVNSNFKEEIIKKIEKLLER